MYSSEDFERLFIRYKGEAYPRGESIQTFCHRNNVPYNLSEEWYKEIRHKVVEVEIFQPFFSAGNGEGQGDSPAAEGRSGW